MAVNGVLGGGIMAEAIIAPVQDQMTAEFGPITADLGMIVARRRGGSDPRRLWSPPAGR